eukprot:scaffold15131_cov64-Skeletonema_dohrnii-CCMP3373.AAC.1
MTDGHLPFNIYDENNQDFLELGRESAIPVLDMSEAAYIEHDPRSSWTFSTITDYEKAVAELSNNKISVSGSIFRVLCPKRFSLVTGTSDCGESAVHAAWRHKRTCCKPSPDHHSSPGKNCIRYCCKFGGHGCWIRYVTTYSFTDIVLKKSWHMTCLRPDGELLLSSSKEPQVASKIFPVYSFYDQQPEQICQK